jgi:hypothetical protein
MGISVGHVQPHLLICYESKGQSGPPFGTKHPIITRSQRPKLNPNIGTCPADLTSKRACPFSSQIHRTSWLSLPAKVVVAEQALLKQEIEKRVACWLRLHGAIDIQPVCHRPKQTCWLNSQSQCAILHGKRKSGYANDSDA